jgi:hypothetical protein
MQYDDDAEKYGYEREMTPLKCDELQSVYIDRTDNWVRNGNNTGKLYLKSEVDAAIAELKEAWRSEHEACEALKRKLEDVQASAYADSVDAGMRERRLQRALWLARALRARDIQRYWIAATCAPITERACRVWNNIEIKCLKKAEEYK